ncbi:hypothetical protein AU152_gp61 [Mycobacterium phage Phlei]|uniref:Uncharacterized protein n=1 Tax=Mycobacterium phage Phlei TaxID=1690684 RepID=A0A0N9BDN6_9CAUD|nr:hypothetical protein AU152_gp61 [Mycobacterium phage Phlei]ALA48174.1 hypothetical protein [Mycobacterium phage Phlei]
MKDIFWIVVIVWGSIVACSPEADPPIHVLKDAVDSIMKDYWRIEIEGSTC